MAANEAAEIETMMCHLNIRGEECLLYRNKHFIYVLLILEKDDDQYQQIHGIKTWFNEKKNDESTSLYYYFGINSHAPTMAPYHWDLEM